MCINGGNQITTINNKCKTYAFTIKSLGANLDADYSDFLDKLAKYNIKIHYKQGERDPKGKFHFHGLIDIPKGFFRKKLVTDGNNLNLKEFYPGDDGSDNWKKYCYKDTPENEKPTDIQKVRKKLF